MAHLASFLLQHVYLFFLKFSYHVHIEFQGIHKIIIKIFRIGWKLGRGHVFSTKLTTHPKLLCMNIVSNPATYKKT